MLSTTLSMGLSALDGLVFKDIGKCLYCGGTPLPYDTKEKRYVTLSLGETKHTIVVKIRRYVCRDCGKLLYADEPFYPDTRIGSAIIDLALGLSQTNSLSHTAAIMQAMGIDINRSSIRNYSHSYLPMPEVSTIYGFPLPNSFISLISRGISAVSIHPSDVLKISNYPSRYISSCENRGTAYTYFMKKKEEKR